jgi:hypothetical protein
MTYYIFLKSLRSLEEFRKNPHVKIPHKSSCANFQALINSKIQFLIRKFFFLISARPPPLFFFQPSRGPPPPSRSGPVGQNLSVFRTCPFSSLQDLSVFATCPISLLIRFLHFKTCPIRSENLSDPAASPTGRRTRARPKSHWRICRKAYSLQLYALWQRHLLSLTSLPCGARLSAPSPSSPVGRPLPLIASGHPAPPGLQPRDARRGLQSTP